MKGVEARCELLSMEKTAISDQLDKLQAEKYRTNTKLSEAEQKIRDADAKNEAMQTAMEEIVRVRGREGGRE